MPITFKSRPIPRVNRGHSKNIQKEKSIISVFEIHYTYKIYY